MMTRSNHEELHAILALRDQQGLSLYDNIRNGTWNSDLLKEVAKRLERVMPIEFEQITKKDFQAVLTYLEISFNARSSWPYPPKSPESQSLAQFIRFLARIFRSEFPYGAE
jgi:hypothetical protein